jgi:hypothetical protein
MPTRFWTWTAIAAALATAAWPTSEVLQVVLTATICTAALERTMRTRSVCEVLHPRSRYVE